MNSSSQIAVRDSIFCRHQSSSRQIFIWHFPPPCGSVSSILFNVRRHSSSAIPSPCNILLYFFSCHVCVSRFPQVMVILIIDPLSMILAIEQSAGISAVAPPRILTLTLLWMYLGHAPQYNKEVKVSAHAG